MTPKTIVTLLLTALALSGCSAPTMDTPQEQADGTPATLPVQVIVAVEHPEQMYQSNGAVVLVTIRAPFGDVGDAWAGLTVPAGVEVLSGREHHGALPSDTPTTLQYQVRADPGTHILTAWVEDFTLVGGRTVDSQSILIQGDSTQATATRQTPTPIDFQVAWKIDDQDPNTFRITLSSPSDVSVQVEATAPVNFAQGDPTWTGTVEAGNPHTLSFQVSDDRPDQDGTYAVSVLIKPHPGLDPRLHAVTFCYVYEGDNVHPDTTSPGCRTPQQPSPQGTAQPGLQK